MRAPSLAPALAWLAALPMYDLPQLRTTNDALWQAIVAGLEREGLVAPHHLTRETDLEEIWRDPRLLLAQTCGYPLTTSLKGAVQIVATPRYSAPGCAGAFHRSAIIVAARSGVTGLEDLRGGCCAFNERRSNTGANLLRAELAPLARDGRFFAEVLETGSHAGSLAAVALGNADVAAIDCVTLALLARDDPDLVAAVRALIWTRACPGLPLITGLSTPPEGVQALRRVLQGVASDPALDATRRILMIDGFSLLPDEQYSQILELERGAAELGYPELA